MLKRMFIYLLLFTFGLLNVPKVYWHDCERQHVHEDVDNDHTTDQAQFSSADNCSICDFQFFPFAIHQYVVHFYLEHEVMVHGAMSTIEIATTPTTSFLRGPPTTVV